MHPDILDLMDALTPIIRTYEKMVSDKPEHKNANMDRLTAMYHQMLDNIVSAIVIGIQSQNAQAAEAEKPQTKMGFI